MTGDSTSATLRATTVESECQKGKATARDFSVETNRLRRHLGLKIRTHYSITFCIEFSNRQACFYSKFIFFDRLKHVLFDLK
jgi:hypothetical protein